MRRHCIGMATAQYLKFSEPHLQFFCRHCIRTGAGFNFCSSLARIAVCAPDVGKMKAMAESERNLLHFYNICLPQVIHVSGKDATAHEQSVHLLHDNCGFWHLMHYNKLTYLLTWLISSCITVLRITVKILAPINVFTFLTYYCMRIEAYVFIALHNILRKWSAWVILLCSVGVGLLNVGK